MSYRMSSDSDTSSMPLHRTAVELGRLSIPGEIYHYTNQSGLFGILHSRTLWASDVRYLNDSSELRYGVAMITERLKARSGGPNIGLWPVFQLVFDRLESIRVAPHIASFSEVPDDLSQWRAYGSYCLGFNVDLNQQLNLAKATFGPVCYDPELQQSIVEDLVDEILDEAAKVGAPPLPLLSATRVGLSVYQTALFMKHPAFAAEREWRALLWGTIPGIVKLGIRTTATVPTPYLALPLASKIEVTEAGLGCLEKVIVGPRAHQDLTVAAVERACRNYGIAATVSPSAIPYRTW